MRARQVCWCDPDLAALAGRFVPAADEVWRLQHGKDPECRLFQGFCEEGHYGGRTEPTDTRQGIYCCTPSGRFLASVNTTDPARMRRMLEEALAAWEAMPAAQRLPSADPAARTQEVRRAEARFPEGGLALRVIDRDLPREDAPGGWRGRAWNVDSLWYRPGEARSMLPADVAPGARVSWPEAVVQRLVCRALRDDVRGQTNGFRPRDVLAARVTTRVTSVEAGVVEVVFEGESRTSTAGAWPEDGRVASLEGAGSWVRGVQTTIAGEAAWDLAAGCFVRFDLVAAGTRFGRTRYNGREDDVDEAPIGFAIVLDAADPDRRVAPAELALYGW